MTKINQRQIVEVSFNLKDKPKTHMVVVLSNSEIIEEEEGFVGIMLTENKNNDEYSFELTDGMLIKKLSKPTQIRLHLISFFWFKDISKITPYNSIKKIHFENLIEQINSVTFGLDCLELP